MKLIKDYDLLEYNKAYFVTPKNGYSHLWNIKTINEFNVSPDMNYNRCAFDRWEVYELTLEEYHKFDLVRKLEK